MRNTCWSIAGPWHATGTAWSRAVAAQQGRRVSPFMTRVVPLRDPQGVVFAGSARISTSASAAQRAGMRRAGMRPKPRCKSARDQNWLIEAEKLAALGRLVAGSRTKSTIRSHQSHGRVVAERKADCLPRNGAGTLKRSSLNEFVDAVRDGFCAASESLNRAAGLIQSFKQVRPTATIRSFGRRPRRISPSRSPRAYGRLCRRTAYAEVECEQGLSIRAIPAPTCSADQPFPQRDRACLPAAGRETLPSR